MAIIALGWRVSMLLYVYLMGDRIGACGDTSKIGVSFGGFVLSGGIYVGKERGQ